MNYAFTDFFNITGNPVYDFLIFLAVMIWSLSWKGVALWKSAQTKSVPWFVALLIINTFGIFEILYIFIFSKIKIGQKTNNPPSGQ